MLVYDLHRNEVHSLYLLDLITLGAIKNLSFFESSRAKHTCYREQAERLRKIITMPLVS